MLPFVQLGTNIDRRFSGGVAGFLGDQYNPFVLPGDPSSPASRSATSRWPTAWTPTASDAG